MSLVRSSRMRVFLIWSAVAACVGLMLAGAGVWAWWSLVGQYQPKVVRRETAEVQRLLDAAPWMSDGAGGEPVYVVGYRDAAALRRFQREEQPRLRAAGADVRVIVFARPDRDGAPQSTAAERATAAELWLSRDWTLYRRWLSTPARNWTAAGLPSADADPVRAEALAAGRGFVARLTDRLKGSGVEARYPLILWRDREGRLKACACSDARSWAALADDLPRAAPEVLAEAPPIPAAPTPSPPPATALPYPLLPTPEGPIPREAVPVEPVAPPPVSAPVPRVMPRPESRPEARPARPAPTQPRPRATPPSRPRAEPERKGPRRPPEAKRQDDSTFF